MPHNHEWQSRIKAVEREFLAMRQATDYFLQAALSDPTILLENVLHREIIRAAQHLEGTYIVRLFAEFETGARQYWEANCRLTRKPLICLTAWGPAAAFQTHRAITRIWCVNTATTWSMSVKGNPRRYRWQLHAVTCAISLASCRGNGEIQGVRIASMSPAPI